MDSDNVITHLPFFEHLGTVEEGSAEWHSTKAGLVTLRLVEQRLRAATVRIDPWNVRAVRRAVEEVEDTDPLQSVLAGIVDEATLPGATAARVLPRLMAYGRALDLRARWALASDVYHAVIRHADPAHEADLVVDAYLRIGYCARTVGNWEESLSAYLAAGRIADLLGDRMRGLRIVIARAALARERGNFPQADELLVSALNGMQNDGESRPLRALALQERAIVSRAQKEYEKGLGYAYQALELVDNPVNRDRILTDIASFFLELGVYSAARDAYLIVATTAQEQWVRWAATINLIELATVEHVELLFDAHRRELRDVELPPLLEASYHLYVGRGLIAFGHVSEGRSHLLQALALAEEHRLHELIFEAQQSLDQPAPTAARSKSSVFVSDDVQEIAGRIGAMRGATR